MKKIYFFLLLLLCQGVISYGQTYAINPAGDGGFETGADLAANGWTYAGATGNNAWYVGTGAGANAGDKQKPGRTGG